MRSDPKRPVHRVSVGGADRAPFAALALLFVAALAWRAAWAATLPCISRDGVTFCNYARELGERGAAYLREPSTHQHPLYPLLVLAAQRTLRAVGFADSPLTWQSAGQLVSLFAHAGVLLLTAVLTMRLVGGSSVEGGVAPAVARRAPLMAMLLAALLPMHAWLGAEPMSDELHLMFHLGAIATLCGMPGAMAALAGGALGGLAFLTRPEGAALTFVALAGLLRMRAGLLPRGRAALLVIVGFIAMALPYWAAVGKFSAKKDPLAAEVQLAISDDRSRVTTASSISPREPYFAKLERTNLDWYAILPEVAHQLFRCGRVVVPLLALAGLMLVPRSAAHLRNLIVAAALGHLTLCAWLLHKHDYLDQRHLLPVVGVMTPLAGLALAQLLDGRRPVRSPALKVLLLVVMCFPLAWYSLHRPHGEDRIWPLAAAKLRETDASVRERPILTGSSGRRLAFYTGSRWIPWFEYPEDYPAIVTALERAAGGYFAVQLGEGFELRGNREMLDRLMADPAWSGRLVEVWRATSEDARDKSELRILRVGG
ncbi:MAG: hypothetical protein SF069_09265 [Phycisphaerae bacterium]|nr:hypothetical protein [Phycisphaerae bacterium]